MKRFTSLAVLLVLSLVAFPSFATTPPPADAIVLDAGGAAPVFDAGIVDTTVPALNLPPAVTKAVPSPDDDNFITTIAMFLIAAVKTKWYSGLIAGIVSLLVWVLRKFVAPKVAALRTPVATLVMVFAVSFTGMLATLWGAGAAIKFSDVTASLGVAFTAIGGFSALDTILKQFEDTQAWAKTLRAFLNAKKAEA